MNVLSQALNNNYHTEEKARNKNTNSQSFHNNKIEKNNKKELAISVAASIGLTAVVFGSLIFKHKIDTNKVKPLVEDIKFQNCDTLDDAIKFGKEVLGIKKYKGFSDSDLDIVNWINQGLVNINNTSKGRAVMPCEIILGHCEHAATMNPCGVLTIDKNFLTSTKNKAKAVIRELVEDAEIFIKELENKKNFSHWENYLQDFISKSPILRQKSEKSSYSSTFSLIYHEIGHLEHAENTKSTFYFLDKKHMRLFKASKDIASKVSAYATTSPCEFVAECFAKLCDGIKLDDDVMKLYEKLGGFPL